MKWEKVKLGNVCEITSSKRIFYSEYVDDGVPFYRSKEIIESDEGKVIENPLYISVDKYNEIKEKFGVPQIGDMLLTSVGTIGIPYIIKKKDCFYFKDGNLTWFRDFREGLNSKYLYYWINNMNIRHNNCAEGDKNYKKVVAKMSQDELESWYDETYQLCLLAFLELDNVERTKKVAELKASFGK